MDAGRDAARVKITAELVSGTFDRKNREQVPDRIHRGIGHRQLNRGVPYLFQILLGGPSAHSCPLLQVRQKGLPEHRRVQLIETAVQSEGGMLIVSRLTVIPEALCLLCQ